MKFIHAVHVINAGILYVQQLYIRDPLCNKFENKHEMHKIYVKYVNM